MYEDLYSDHRFKNYGYVGGHTGYKSNYLGLRPIISLPSSIVVEKHEDNLWNIE